MVNYKKFGFLFVVVLGSLSHFFYEWSGQNPVVGLFCPVSESVWEHMKMLFFPMLLFSGLGKRSLFCVRTAGNLLGTFLIPVIFYTYSGILGFSNLWFDILTFLVAAAAAFWFSHKYAESKQLQKHCRFVLIAAFLLLICFFVFTFYPPKAGLFQRPDASVPVNAP